MRPARPLLAAAALCGVLVSSGAMATPTPASGAPTHQPRVFRAFGSGGDSPFTPPAPPCPLPRETVPVAGTTVGPCVMIPEAAGTGLPVMGNMAYWGGRVQVHPRVYLVYLGWGREGAFTGDCAPVKIVAGAIKATLKCDPDGAGKKMADFVSQMGGTGWAGSQTQYYQIVGGVKSYVHNDKNVLAGIWVDDISPTSAKLTYRDLAVEADKARKHFRIKDKDAFDANVVILQPQHFSDPLAQSSGYCAWHDIIEPAYDPVEFKGLKADLPFTNMPYVLNQGAGCGKNLVNAGDAGKLDGFTLALGHEIEEAVTDPGAEDHLNGTAIGGWYDPLDANENADKCAYVGINPVAGGSVSAVPGRGANIRGNRGGLFPVQALWSNDAANGIGYCAGAGTDLGF